MADGEVAAVFKGLAEDADQAGGNIAESVAKISEQTADNEEANVTRTLDAEAQNAKSFGDIADGEAGPTAPSAHPDTAGTPAGDTPTTPEPSGPPTADAPVHEPPDEGSIADNNQNPAENSQPTETVPQSKDPIDFTTGRVLLDQVDLELPGTLPLRLTRCHRSTLRTGLRFGRTWSSTLDQRIEVTAGAVHFVAADGMLLKYPLPGGSAPVLPVQGVPWPLRRTDDGGHAIVDVRSGQTLHFAPSAGSASPITAITDRNGNRIDFDHDDLGVVTEIRHSGGYRIAVGAVDGLVTELRLVDPLGADVIVRRYGYDTSRQLVEVMGASGRPTSFEYDAEGRLARWEDSNGMWYRYHYDAEGRCVRAEGRDGYLDATVAYDRVNLITRSTDSLGHTTSYHLNDRLQVVREVSPLGDEKTFEWDAHHRLLARTDALGATTRYRYDDQGKLTLITLPDGTYGSAEYNDAGAPITVTEPGGATWRQDYDERGNLIAATDPTGATTSYAYDEHGGLTAVRDALGNQVRMTTDPAGLPVAVTDSTGQTCRYHRDFCGRVTEIVDPVGGSTRFAWTVDGKPLSRTAADGWVEKWNYDGEANLVDHVDATGMRAHTEITYFDRPASQTDPAGTRLEFRYNTELRLTSVTNPQGLVWRYEYDAAGNLVRETDFNGRALTYRHDPAGRLIERVNGVGQVTSLRRDVLGNLVERRTDDATTVFEYDRNGRLRRAVNRDAELIFERDLLGRMVAETCNGRTVRNVYDPLGRRVERHTPSGARSGWSYDARDLPTALHASGHVIQFHHDDAGREVGRDLAAGVALTQTWDANHRLHTQAITNRAFATGGNSPLVQRRSYRYRPDGRPTAIVDQLSGPREFELDALGQVTAVTGSGWTERYAYDAAGNLTHADWPAPAGSAGAEATGPREYAGTLLRRAGRVRYAHDAQGRVTLRQQTRLSAKPSTWHYAWDAEDRLAGVTTPEGHRWRYQYDPLGRRIAKQRLLADGTVAEMVTFAWDGGRLAEQVGGEGITVWDWEPGRFRPVSQRERTPSRAAGGEGVDERFYAIVTDLVGTPAELVDSNGRLAWRMRSTLWGAPLSEPVGAAYTPLRFPGQYFDPESGLNYNYHRYYDSETGRYTSNDPLGLNPAPNPRSYVPNPTVLTDPVGLAPYNIYRGMKDDNGSPKVEATARGLGSRDNDIEVDENGMVHRPPEGGNTSGKNGVSTAPEDPQNLPSFRRPAEFGGTGSDPVWSLDPDKLPEGLVGIRDGTSHVSIAPARTMPFDEYQGLIASTKGLWEKVDP